MENKPRTLKIEMNAIQEVETVMANISRLKGSSDEFGKISVTEDHTKNEREVIKRYVSEAKEKTEEDPNYIYKIRGTPKTYFKVQFVQYVTPIFKKGDKQLIKTYVVNF